ncbi:Lipase [Sergentomyia squamirostris]
MLRILILLAAVVCVLAIPAEILKDFQDVNPSADNEQFSRFRSVTEMIEYYGYPVETHVATTGDGYLLTMHRIPYGRAPGAGPALNKKVVFLQHGLLCSSADWVVVGPQRALAYLLADEGYDVWMGNARGNTHSRDHVTLNPDRRAFWDFSWHEIGVHDIPAMIDLALRVTGRDKLHYVGHSQGTTSLFIMLSLRPEYNDKILSAHALAPVAFMSNLRSPFVRAFAPFVDSLDTMTNLLGMNEFMPSNSMMQMGGYLTCRDSSPFQEVCANVLFLIAGFNSEQLNRTELPAIMANTPAGAATRQLVHYGQLYNSGRFRQFDHGRIGNMAEYGSFSPPDYPLDRITAPIALHFSDNDWLAAVVDVQTLRSRLRNVIGAFRVPLASFNHLDFQWAIDIRPLCYNRVISLINRFN